MLGALGLMGGTLAARAGRNDGRCINSSVCGRCPAVSGCGLPQALSYRQAASAHKEKPDAR
jgi:hypothetical protein